MESLLLTLLAVFIIFVVGMRTLLSDFRCWILRVR